MYAEKFVIQAEYSLIGAILIEPYAVMTAIRGKVSESDFMSEPAKAIYRAANHLVDQGKPCDATLIQAEVGESVSVEFCAKAMQMTPTTVNAGEYAEIVRTAAQERRACHIGFSLSQGEINPIEALAALQEHLRTQSSTTIHTPAEAAQAFADYVNDISAGKRRPCLSTGYRKLDTILSGGFKQGGLYTVATRPGIGKTLLGLNLAENAAAGGHKTLYVSLEMTERELWGRRTANLTGINSAVFSIGIRDDDEKRWKLFGDAMNLMHDRPLFIRDIPSTVAEIETEARCLDELELIVIDHIGLIKPDVSGSRYEKMTDVTHKLKQLALALRIPIVGLCQVNRESEKRSVKLPLMSDLRDSGSIEEDSDVVIMLHRPAMDLPEEQRPPDWELQELIINVTKNRHGPIGLLRFKTCLATGRVIE